jgi:SAM-dependent methyltransferase
MQEPVKPVSEFDLYSRNYSDAINQALAFSGLKVDLFTRAKAEYLLELVQKLHPPMSNAEVIDIGCGVGNSHPQLCGQFAKMVGVDVSAACIATAIERNPSVQYSTYDGLHLPYPGATFDVAFAICVFHHVPVSDRGGLVGEIRRILRPGGLFVIFEHNPFNPLTRHVVNRCEFDKNAILLRRDETESLLENAGFRDVYTRYILTVPALGMVRRVVDGIFSRVPIGAQYYTVGRAQATSGSQRYFRADGL